MKRFMLTITIVAVFAAACPAQFRSQTGEQAVTTGLYTPGNDFGLFGWFNPANFHMRHSFSLSYATFGGQGMSLGSYTNSMMYAFSERLNAQADVTLTYSPYASGQFGTNNALNGIRLSRAQVDYRPWDDVLFQVQYRSYPYGSYYYSPFYSPFTRETGF